MAVGDIVKFGMLSSNGNTYRQKSTIEAFKNGYYNFDYTNFNFIDALDEDNKWTWIEANIDIGKIYICPSIINVGSYNQLQRVLNKNMNIGGKTYQLILLTREQIEEQVPISISRQIDFAKNTGQYVDAYTCTTQHWVVQFGKTIEDAVYMCYFNSYADEWAHYSKVENPGSNDTEYFGNYNYQGIDASSTSAGYIPILKLINSTPTISGKDENLKDKTSNFSITYSVNDADTTDELTVTEKLNGSIIRTLKNPVKGNELTLTISEERFANLSINSTNTIEIEVTDGSATTYRRYTFVKTNSAPFINYTGQTNLGQLTTKPSITYTVKDNEGDAITVTEKLNGEVINQFSATTNTNYTVGITDTFWLTCGSNTNTVEIIASDALGGSSSKTITFSRKITKLQIVMKNAIETDAAATKIMVSPDWDKTGCTGKVEVCNNGFDASPTWEDMTTMSVLNRPYTFTNSTKTAAKWGIKIRLTLTKNEGYEGEVAIYGFGGAFE